jgi:hypothetical protein
MLGQRPRQGGRSPDPISQRGAVKVDLLPSVDFRLSVERQMIAIFADQHMGQQPWTGAPPVDGATGQGGLGERLTARAGHARAGDFADHEAPRDILQLLRHILTKGPQGPAAFGAGFAWRKNPGLALQVVGQWGAAVPGFVGLVVTDDARHQPHARPSVGCRSHLRG